MHFYLFLPLLWSRFRHDKQLLTAIFALGIVLSGIFRVLALQAVEALDYTADIRTTAQRDVTIPLLAGFWACNTLTRAHAMFMVLIAAGIRITSCLLRALLLRSC